MVVLHQKLLSAILSHGYVPSTSEDFCLLGAIQMDMID